MKYPFLLDKTFDIMIRNLNEGAGYEKYPVAIMRMNWKRIIACMLMCTTLMSLTACGTDDKNANSDKKQDLENEQVAATEATTEEATTEVSEDTIVITVLTDKKHLVDTKFEEYKKVFESDNEDVIVHIEAVDNYEQTMRQRLRTGDYGDVLLIPDFVTSYQLSSYFEPLGTVEELSETYDERFLQVHAVDGVVYGLPRYANVYGVAYNEVVFANSGELTFPTTSGEFLSMLKKMENSQPGVIPYYTGFGNGEWLWQWQMQVWGAVSADATYRNQGIIEEDAPFTEGKPNYIVHKLLYDIVKNGLCETFVEGENWRPIYRQMNEGKIGCMLLSSDYIYELQSAGTNPDDINFMPFPYVVDGVRYATVETDYSYAINKNCENKELAREWITYMLNKSGFSKSEGALSIKKKAALPTTLQNFADVEWIVNPLGKSQEVKKYQELNGLSGLRLDDEKEKNRLIEEAGKEDGMSFEEIMNEWNERWKNARQGVRYEPES